VVIVVAVVFEEQVQPSTFEFALHHLVDQELDLSALDLQDAEAWSELFAGVVCRLG
jgi:hypothetical protein